MKRAALALGLTLVVCATAGWAVAYYEHLGRVKQAAAEAHAASLRTGQICAALIRRCDAASLIFEPDGLGDGRKSGQAVADPRWCERLAQILERTASEPVPHGLWLSFPMVRIYRNGRPVMSLMIKDKVLRIFSDVTAGDFLLDAESAGAIQALIRSPGSKGDGTARIDSSRFSGDRQVATPTA